MSLYRKLQQKGYSHRGFSQVRHLFNEVMKRDEEAPRWKAKHKKRDYCHKNSSHTHEYERIKPRWWGNHDKELSVEEHYRKQEEQYEEERKERGAAKAWPVYFYFACIHCGHEEMERKGALNKHIVIRLGDRPNPVYTRKG